ncbi:DUF3703 domain-containing protein [Nonomuraea sp. NBC_01738]|uniref:hypothetical protein n=1 Tax=Nonomuraea sp. NBC_01738 TaxID=2976003 RepID=UPI002E0E28D1|nr:DUF3703 domain-containing protein [Nonomuraea sp. NBC_01738]
MIGRPMPARVRAAYRIEMNAARTSGDAAARWRHLERAHIQHDRREALGQVARIIVAVPRLPVVVPAAAGKPDLGDVTALQEPAGQIAAGAAWTPELAAARARPPRPRPTLRLPILSSAQVMTMWGCA